MKRILLLLHLALALTAIRFASAQVLQLPPGSNAPILNVVRSGSGAPANSLGNPGDFYIDTTAWAIYGPKASAWPSGISLVGPAGAAGAAGAQGSPGQPGPSGTGGYLADAVAGTIDGTNATFTLTYAPNPANSLILSKNGAVLKSGVDYTLSGNTITFVSGAKPQSGDSLEAWYEVASPDPCPAALSNALGCVEIPSSGGLSVDADGNLSIAFPALGLVKSSGSGFADAAFGDIVSLFGGGNCSGYLKSDGSCDTPSGGGGGSGTVNAGTTGQFAWYVANGTAVSGHTLASSDITGALGFTPQNAAAAVPGAYYCPSTGDTSGVTTAFSCSTSSSLTSLTVGTKILWSLDETGGNATATLNVNGLGAKTIEGSYAPVAGLYDLTYDGTEWRVLTPGQSQIGSSFLIENNTGSRVSLGNGNADLCAEAAGSGRYCYSAFAGSAVGNGLFLYSYDNSSHSGTDYAATWLAPNLYGAGMPYGKTHVVGINGPDDDATSDRVFEWRSSNGYDQSVNGDGAAYDLWWFDGAGNLSLTGNIKEINGASTNFPSSNAAGALTNDGSGNFSYVANFPAVTLQSSANGALSWTHANGSGGNPTPSLVFPSKIQYKTAVCQAGTASAAFSLPSSNAPSASCVTGTNSNYGVLTFSATGQSIQDHLKLPPDWTGAVDIEFTHRSAATTGNIVWNIATACVADGATGDPAFNTAQTVSTAAQGTTLQWKTVSLTGITVTGCAANNELLFQIGLDASTTTTGNIDLIGIRFTVRRAL